MAKNIQKLMESQSGRHIPVCRSPAGTWYSFQLKDHIMKSEKKTIYTRSAEKLNDEVRRYLTSIQIANAFRPSAIFVAVQ